MEIALAIPAPNEGKYNWSNSAGQGLIHMFPYPGWLALTTLKDVLYKL